MDFSNTWSFFFCLFRLWRTRNARAERHSPAASRSVIAVRRCVIGPRLAAHGVSRQRRRSEGTRGHAKATPRRITPVYCNVSLAREPNGFLVKNKKCNAARAGCTFAELPSPSPAGYAINPSYTSLSPGPVLEKKQTNSHHRRRAKKKRRQKPSACSRASGRACTLKRASRAWCSTSSTARRRDRQNWCPLPWTAWR